MTDPRKNSPSYHRNIEPIVAKLHKVLSSQTKRVLEIGSGSGQHVARFAQEFPDITFQPTEYDADNLASIDAWSEGKSNVCPAAKLDVTAYDWFTGEVQPFDTLLCFNVIHISPWEVTEAIFQGASKYMTESAQLMFYGPFKIDGEQTSESNAQFELWLKDKDARFGIRDIADLETEAAPHGFSLDASHAMPANNFIQVFTRT